MCSTHETDYLIDSYLDNIQQRKDEQLKMKAQQAYLNGDDEEEAWVMLELQAS